MLLEENDGFREFAKFPENDGHDGFVRPVPSKQYMMGFLGNNGVLGRLAVAFAECD